MTRGPRLSRPARQHCISRRADGHPFVTITFPHESEWLEEEPAPSEPPPPPDEPATPDRPSVVPQHTFFTSLSHPGAIALLALLAGGGAMFFFARSRSGRRRR